MDEVFVAYYVKWGAADGYDLPDVLYAGGNLEHVIETVEREYIDKKILGKTWIRQPNEQSVQVGWMSDDSGQGNLWLIWIDGIKLNVIT